MAANKQQGNYLTLFWISITVLCAGLAYLSTGMGKIILLLGLIGLAASFLGFARIKSLEGNVPNLSGAGMMKLAGIVITWLGWLVAVMGLHITASVGGRMLFALVGIGISLFGIIGVLATAFGRRLAGKL